MSGSRTTKTEKLQGRKLLSLSTASCDNNNNNNNNNNNDDDDDDDDNNNKAFI